MVVSSMNDTGGLHTSTPFQCRHDSGYKSFTNEYKLPLELSPIRKCNKSPMVFDDSFKKFFEIQGHCVQYTVVARKLSFSHDSTFNVSHRYDSGFSSGQIDSSPVSTQDKCGKKSECPTDENCNLTCTQDSTTQGQLQQPYKFICKDHSHEKGVCSKNISPFDSYQILPTVKKNTTLDLLSELDRRNCYGIVSDILSYLSDCDLVQSSNVSKRWKEIINGNKNANSRKNVYINNRRNAACSPAKENGFKAESPSGRSHATAFTHVGNAITKQPLVSDTCLGRFDAFFQELKLGQGALMKCPKCFYPAKAVSGYQFCCTRKMCQHAFCKKCQGPYLDNHVCTVPELDKSVSTIVVCSKKSKKNLRRLRA